MLTLKHISSEGDERIFPILRAGYHPHKQYNPDSMPNHVYAWIGKEETETIECSDGSVYIMNELGKTIASYHISPITSQ